MELHWNAGHLRRSSEPLRSAAGLRGGRISAPRFAWSVVRSLAGVVLAGWLSLGQSAWAQNPSTTDPKTTPATSNPPSTANNPASPTPPPITKGADGVYDLTFDHLKFEIPAEQGFERSQIPREIEQLDGAHIRLRGFIRPSFKQTGLTKFVFVRDNQACCFGPGAALYDCILVELGENHATDFTVRPISISGDFFLKEYKGPDGKVWAIYRLKNGVVD